MELKSAVKSVDNLSSSLIQKKLNFYQMNSQDKEIVVENRNPNLDDLNIDFPPNTGDQASQPVKMQLEMNDLNNHRPEREISMSIKRKAEQSPPGLGFQHFQRMKLSQETETTNEKRAQTISFNLREMVLNSQQKQKSRSIRNIIMEEEPGNEESNPISNNNSNMINKVIGNISNWVLKTSSVKKGLGQKEEERRSGFREQVEKDSRGFSLMMEVSIITTKEVNILWNMDQKIVDTAIYLKSIEKNEQDTQSMLYNIYPSKRDRTLVEIMKSLICYKVEAGESRATSRELILNKNQSIESFTNCYSSFLKNPSTYFYFYTKQDTILFLHRKQLKANDFSMVNSLEATSTSTDQPIVFISYSPTSQLKKVLSLAGIDVYQRESPLGKMRVSQSQQVLFRSRVHHKRAMQEVSLLMISNKNIQCLQRILLTQCVLKGQTHKIVANFQFRHASLFYPTILPLELQNYEDGKQKHNFYNIEATKSKTNLFQQSNQRARTCQPLLSGTQLLKKKFMNKKGLLQYQTKFQGLMLGQNLKVIYPYITPFVNKRKQELAEKIDSLGVEVINVRSSKEVLSEALSYESLTHLFNKYHAKDRGQVVVKQSKRKGEK